LGGYVATGRVAPVASVNTRDVSGSVNTKKKTINLNKTKPKKYLS